MDLYDDVLGVIMSNLDLDDVGNFRQTSRQSNRVFDTWPQSKDLSLSKRYY